MYKIAVIPGDGTGPEVTVEATEAIVCLGVGLNAPDLPCESDREPHDPIDPENDRKPEKGMCGSPWLMALR